MTTPNNNVDSAGFVAGDAYLVPVVGPIGPKGEKGDVGPSGPASSIPAVFSGPHDPPDYIEGAKVGDSWINTVTGDTFVLTEG